MSRKQTALERFREANADSLRKIVGIACEHSKYQSDGEFIASEASMDAMAEMVMDLIKKVSKNGRQPASGDPNDGSNVTPIGRAKAAGD